jgi:sirohydrochlorin ferrochelatase
VYFVASALHGGEQADDLPAVLPQYAANELWLVSHTGQLLGMLLLLAGWAAALTWLSQRRSAATRVRVVLLLAAEGYHARTKVPPADRTSETRPLGPE